MYIDKQINISFDTTKERDLKLCSILRDTLIKNGFKENLKNSRYDIFTRIQKVEYYYDLKDYENNPYINPLIKNESFLLGKITSIVEREIN